VAVWQCWRDSMQRALAFEREVLERFAKAA
jgi:hypothetical protein